MKLRRLPGKKAAGIGAVGGALVGMFWFHEPRDAFRLVSMALVIAGILGLKFTARA